MKCQLIVQVNGGVNDGKVQPCPRESTASTYLEGQQVRVCDIHLTVIKEEHRQLMEKAHVGAVN